MRPTPLIQYFDIIKYLEDRGIEYATSGKNVTRGWVEIQSPYANDKSKHLGINLRSKIFSCWKSGQKGPITKLIQTLEGCSWNRACSIVDEFTDFSLVTPEELRLRKNSGENILPKNAVTITESTCHPAIANYLAERRYTVAQAEQFDCFYCDPLHLDEEWRFRLLIPVYQDYQLVTFVGRSIGKNVDLRYKNNPEEKSILPAKSCIYGIDDVAAERDILVVEGIFDRWRLRLNGIPNVVSTLGTMTTKEQHYQLKQKKPKKVWVLFDAKAEEDAYNLTRALPFCDTETLLLEGTKDPDNFEEAEIEELKAILNAH